MKDTYTLRSGVVLSEIFDEYYLIAAQDAGKYVSAIRAVNETGAYFWKLFEKHLPMDDMVRTAMTDYDITEEQAENAIDSFFELLCGAGYIITDEVPS